MQMAIHVYRVLPMKSTPFFIFALHHLLLIQVYLVQVYYSYTCTKYARFVKNEARNERQRAKA